MSLIAFTANYSDHSNDNGFQFEFHCDKCGNGHVTPFKTSKLGMAGGLLRAAEGLLGGSLGGIANAGDQVRDALRGEARDEALREAIELGKRHFKQCSRCGRWVCPEHCWNAVRGQCEECAPDLQEETAAAQATAAREQVWERARATDQLAGADKRRGQRATCPHCGAKVQGKKFCSECGKPLSTKSACQHCGVEIESTAKFCPECGGKKD